MEAQTLTFNLSQNRNQTLLLWAAAVALAMPLTALRATREVEISGSIDWQILLRVVPLGILAVRMLPNALLAIREASVSSLLYAWLLFLGARSLLVCISPDPFYGAMYLYFQLTATIVILGVCRANENNPAWWKSLLAHYLITLVAIAPIAYVINPNMLWVNELYASGASRLRFSGGIGHPFVVAELGCAFIGMALIAETKRQRLFWVLLGSVLLYVSLTKSWIGAMFAGICTVFWLKHKTRRIHVVIGTIVLICGALLFTGNDEKSIKPDATMLTRSGDYEEIVTLTGRTYFWPRIIELWEKSPLFGYGTGSSKKVLYRHASTRYIKITHAHNLYLQVLFEGGIFLFSFLIIFTLAYLLTTRHLLNDAEEHRGTLLLYCGTAILVASIGTNPGLLSCSISFVVWLTIAATYTCPKGRRIKIKW